MTASLKKRRGVVYTPEHIVDLILDNTLPTAPSDLADAVVCDPSCGDGAFLVRFARRALSQLPRADATRALRRMVGYDIDPAAAAKCRANLDAALREFYPREIVDWRIYERDAMNRAAFAADLGRFTHIVGNPPYVRAQHLEQSGRNRIAHGWSLLRGATDLYIVFYELALDLLRRGGTLGFIAPSSWLRSDSGSLLRERLASSHKIIKIIDFGEHQVFSEVTTYSAIAIVQKGGATDRVPVETYDGERLITGGAAMLSPEGPSKPWQIAASEDDMARMRALMRRGPRLGEIADIHVGVQTLADKVFIMPAETAERMRLESWMLRPIVKASVMKNGRDVLDRVVVFPYDADGALLPESRVRSQAPNAYEWLRSNKQRLLNRDKGAFDPKRWYAFGRHVSIVSGFGHKILTSGMNKRPNFQRCPDPAATFYSGYCVKPKDPSATNALMSALNSDDMHFFIKQTGSPYRGGWNSYAKSFIKNFPVTLGKTRDN